MATSGWQTEKFIKQCSANYNYYGNVNIKSITHSGTDLRVTGTVALCSRGTSGYRYNWQNIIYANVAGKGNLTVRPVGYVYVGTDTYAEFDVTISGVAATATTYDLSVNFNSYNINVTLSWPLSFNASGTAPTGLDVTLTSVQDTGATMAVTLNSYGSPSSEADRYIEADIFSTNAFASPYRYDIAKATNSATITVNNNSRTNTSNPLTIIPNTQYWYGAYATNTVMSTDIVKGGFITLPAYISDVTVNDVGGGEVVISVIHASEGTADTAYTEYSYNQTDWTVVQDTFRLTVHSSTTLYIRRRNSTGTTPVRTVSIVPATTIKLYGSVNNQAKEIRKLYGSVNGQAVRIRKLYGSVNGRSKLIFEDVS